MDLLQIDDRLRCGYFLVETSDASEVFMGSICEGLLEAFGARCIKPYPFHLNVGKFSRQVELWDDRAVLADQESLTSLGRWLREWGSENFLTPRKRLGGGQGKAGSGTNILAALRAALDDVDVEGIWLFVASQAGQDVGRLLSELKHKKVPIHVVFLAKQNQFSLAVAGSFHLLARETSGSMSTAYFSSQGQLIEVIRSSGPGPDFRWDSALGKEFKDLKISFRDRDKDERLKLEDQLPLFSLGNPNWNAGGKLRQTQLLSEYKHRQDNSELIRALLANGALEVKSSTPDALSDAQMKEIRSLFRRYHREKERTGRKAARSKPFKELKVKTYKIEGLSSSDSSDESSNSEAQRIHRQAKQVGKLAKKYLGKERLRHRSGSAGERISPTSPFPSFLDRRETWSRPRSVQSRNSHLDNKKSVWRPVGSNGSSAMPMDRSSWMSSAASRRVESTEKFYQMRGKAHAGIQTNSQNSNITHHPTIRRPQIQTNSLKTRSIQAGLSKSNRALNEVGIGFSTVDEPGEVVADQAESIRHLVQQNSQLLHSVLSHRDNRPSSAERQRISRNRERIFRRIGSSKDNWRPTADLKSAVNAQIRSLGSAAGHEDFRKSQKPLRKSQTVLKEEQRDRVEEARGQHTDRQYQRKYTSLLSEVEARNQALAKSIAEPGPAAMTKPTTESYVLTSRPNTPSQPRITSIVPVPAIN